MIVMLFRFLSLVLIVAALMLLGADAIGTLESGGEIKLRSLEAVWSIFVPGGGSILDGLPEAVASPLSAVIGLPAWATFGLLGLLLAFLFRHQSDADDYDA